MAKDAKKAHYGNTPEQTQEISSPDSKKVDNVTSGTNKGILSAFAAFENGMKSTYTDSPTEESVLKVLTTHNERYKGKKFDEALKILKEQNSDTADWIKKKVQETRQKQEQLEEEKLEKEEKQRKQQVETSQKEKEIIPEKEDKKDVSVQNPSKPEDKKENKKEDKKGEKTKDVEKNWLRKGLSPLTATISTLGGGISKVASKALSTIARPQDIFTKTYRTKFRTQEKNHGKSWGPKAEKGKWYKMPAWVAGKVVKGPAHAIKTGVHAIQETLKGLWKRKFAYPKTKESWKKCSKRNYEGEGEKEKNN